MHTHKLLIPGLAMFGEMAYLDIEFTFSGNSSRRASYRLAFCPPSDDPVAAETLYNMIGEEVKTLCVSVVSFADIAQLDRAKQQRDYPVPGEEPVNIFEKPVNSFVLTLSELQYLYATLVDLMLRVADNLTIQVLFFAAERQELHTIYSRYAKRLAGKLGLTFINHGAAYAVRTKNYPA